MAATLSSVFIRGTVRIGAQSVVPVEPEIFEGTNVNVTVPISFGGSPVTFYSTNTQLAVPVEFEVAGVESFSSTGSGTVPITFGGS